ncbi:MAG: DUF6516 family protein [Gemmatimonadaceae bacterium]
MARKKASPEGTDHGLELLLDYHGRIMYLEGGYSMKFEIRRTEATLERPRGLSYSFTLHDEYNHRVIGFDNAHAVKPSGRAAKRPKSYDHWHTTAIDKGRPYKFTDAATLVEDFFRACERYLKAKGITLEGTGDDSPTAGDEK